MIPVEYKDWRGTPMTIGCKVLVPYSGGGGVGIYEGEVVKIKPRVDTRWEYDSNKVWGKYSYDTATVWVKSKKYDGTDEITILRKFENLTVLT